jgi:hypothetical protein
LVVREILVAIIHKKKVSYHFILKKNCETNFFRREPSSAES